MNWFQIEKEVHQGCILSACLFNLYAEDIMWNARLDEAQAGIKIPGRNINNCWYTDYTTHRRKWRGTKNLLMNVKEDSENASFKLNIQKAKIGGGPKMAEE